MHADNLLMGHEGDRLEWNSVSTGQSDRRSCGYYCRENCSIGGCTKHHRPVEPLPAFLIDLVSL